MPVIKKHKNYSLLNFSNSSLKYQIDFPYKLYGTNHTLKNSYKPFLLKIPKIRLCSSIFISNSRSLGILFLKNKETKIYLTKPVFDQILLKYEELSIKINYEDEEISEDEEIVNINDADIANFKKQCIFVKYNEIINDYKIKIICRSAGSFIGWCNYQIICIDCNLSFFIVSSISFNKRFSVQAKEISCDYLVDIRDLNFLSKNCEKIENLESITFNEILKNQIIIIPVEMTELFLEVIFHIFYIFTKKNKKAKIAVCSKIFDKLNTIVNIQSEWLNETFSSSVNSGTEPFSFKSFDSFKSYTDIFEIEEIPQILFISPNELKFLTIDKIFENQTILDFNNSFLKSNFNFNIDIEAEIEELIAKFPFATIFSDSENENSVKLQDNFFCFEEIVNDYKITFKNSDLIQIVEKSNKIEFFCEGILKNENCIFSVLNRKSFIKDLFENKRYFYFENLYYFYNENLIVKIENDCFYLQKIDISMKCVLDKW
ncbi:hypothetical protein GVAV_002020 [Gurleya vavrai]